jgi:hypothetical protein
MSKDRTKAACVGFAPDTVGPAPMDVLVGAGFCRFVVRHTISSLGSPLRVTPRRGTFALVTREYKVASTV